MSILAYFHSFKHVVLREHSANFKLSFVIKSFVLPSFEWPFYTGFTVGT